MITPRVSILIPVYNRESFIGPCIQSAIEQTITDIEVIVVDNASTDKTWEVCKTLARQDSRIRIFRNETNIGPVRNWLRCIDEARGCFGKILFSDDLIDPLFLEKTLPFLYDEEVGFVFTPAIMGTEPWKGQEQYGLTEKTGKLPSSYFIQESLFAGNVPYSPGCAIFRTDDLRKNLVEEIPSPTIKKFYEHGAGPDLLIYLLVAKEYEQIAFVSEPLSFFRKHEGSITISDKSNYINRCYRQARIWFAEQYLNVNTTGKVYAFEWRREYYDGRKFLLPSLWLTNYTKKAVSISLLDVVWVLFNKFIKTKRRSTGRWFKLV